MTRFLFLLLIVFHAVWAEGRTVTDFFTSAPDNIVHLLPQSTRLDMVDYFNYGSSRASDNYFGGKARIKALSDAVAEIEIDSDVDMAIAVLPAKNDTVIAVVTTLSLPAHDSTIKLYNTEWQLLPASTFSMPDYKEWLTKDGLNNLDELNLHLPFIPVEISFNSEATSMILTNRASEYMYKRQFNDFSPWLKDTMTFNVAAGRFILIK